MKKSTFHQAVGALVCAGREDLAREMVESVANRYVGIVTEKQAGAIKKWVSECPARSNFIHVEGLKVQAIPGTGTEKQILKDMEKQFKVKLT